MKPSRGIQFPSFGRLPNKMYDSHANNDPSFSCAVASSFSRRNLPLHHGFGRYSGMALWPNRRTGHDCAKSNEAS